MAFTDNSSLSITDKLWGDTALTQTQSSVIKQTYALLGLSVVAAFAGGYVGATSEVMIRLFSSVIGWVLAMVVINVIPRVAIAARHNPVLGTAALIADGFVSGLVLGPILYYASRFVPGAIQMALLMTGVVFGAITLYVFTTKRRFSAPAGLMTGIMVSLVAAIALNFFMNIGFLGILISAGIGIFGAMILVYGTSEVLNSPEADSAIPGALMLFAGLFNVFVSILNLLLRANRR